MAKSEGHTFTFYESTFELKGIQDLYCTFFRVTKFFKYKQDIGYYFDFLARRRTKNIHVIGQGTLFWINPSSEVEKFGNLVCFEGSRQSFPKGTESET